MKPQELVATIPHSHYHHEHDIRVSQGMNKNYTKLITIVLTHNYKYIPTGRHKFNTWLRLWHYYLHLRFNHTLLSRGHACVIGITIQFH